MSDCLFCKIVAGEIPARVAYEDDQLLAFHDINPKADTHLLVIPKRHIDNLNHLTEADAALMGQLLLKLPVIARQQQLNGFRTITNTGVEGGQDVFHMHFHILGGANLPGF
ncbi:histidine triad nucleotide-binding protein [Bacterioplanes sanyensis]|uniref:Histidine triad nucleotide-binding protein n=1 Tax=Bacterioplanes sanyensis TaxID=1249553 RepID=A0A222FEV6_9GAMM|nr:histidine triad nucleotide-binding protein [Bacterioplanes sanyensis]ASP37607.1 histidine triad nucleotide-binding protein [Bacterioplanes sanyensis]